MTDEQMTAMLRHAYQQLAAGTVRDAKSFADGLIAPVIRSLEARDAAPCRVCAATEPHSGTCSGPHDPRALCAMAPVSGCHCEACLPQGSPFDETRVNIRMIVCATCGNKRCPHATDHRNACTGSNEVGQKGSSWEHVMPAGSTKETP